MRVISKDGLPAVRLGGEVLARVLDGAKHGGVSVSAFIVDAPAGAGPRRHLHPYDEIFIIVDGSVRLEAAGETRNATTDDICIVPAGVPHAFSATGPGRARMVNIHANEEVITEFVDDTPDDTPAAAALEYDRP